MWLLERRKRKTLNNIGKYTFKKRVWIFAAVKSMMIRPLRNGDASSEWVYFVPPGAAAAALRIVLLNQRVRYRNAVFQ